MTKNQRLLLTLGAGAIIWWLWWRQRPVPKRFAYVEQKPLKDVIAPTRTVLEDIERKAPVLPEVTKGRPDQYQLTVSPPTYALLS